VWDAVLAAEEDRLGSTSCTRPGFEVHGLAVGGHARTGIVGSRGGDSDDERRLALRAMEEAGGAQLLDEVLRERQLALGPLGQIDPDNTRALLGEESRSLGADPAGGTRDYTDLSIQTTHHSSVA
jgi:hypothetical protein